MEIIDIKLSDTSSMSNPPRLSVLGSEDKGVIKISNTGTLESLTEKKSVNCGPGLDLLINKKKIHNGVTATSEINLSELEGLDNPINTKSINTKSIGTKSIGTKSIGGIDLSKSSMFSDTSKTSPDIKLNIEPVPDIPINLGTASKSHVDGETWDGFKKFNEIPVDPTAFAPEKPKLSVEEELRLKFSFIRKLEALEKQGITVSRKYTMDDKLAEMQGEYEMIKNDVAKRSSVKFQGKMLMAAISGIEFLNEKFDPFDIKLDGWGEAVGENMAEYDEVFSELHEKYGGKAKMAPELKLLFMLGGSATMLHMTNTMFKSSMPGMDDIMRQNPDLMHQFTQAAAQSMGGQNPGFGNFMSGVMPGAMSGQPPQQQRPQNMMPGGHPQNMMPGGVMPGGVMPPRGSPQSPPVSNRPDLDAARGGNTMHRSERREPRRDNDRDARANALKSERRDMRGPSDISDILSGIKTKKVDIRASQKPDTISVTDLEQMSTQIPNKSKRKPRSERNTINLNL